MYSNSTSKRPDSGLELKRWMDLQKRFSWHEVRGLLLRKDSYCLTLLWSFQKCVGKRLL